MRRFYVLQPFTKNAMSNSAGQFVWYDLMTPDVDAAIRFYAEAVGWGTQKWDGPMPYTMWTAGGVPIGGVMQISSDQTSQGVVPHWLAYVSVADVDATVEKAKKLGGTVVAGPQDIPNTGRFAVLRDPQTALIAIFKSSNDMPTDEAGIGQFSWHELATSDHPAALDFYSTLFGWEKTSDFDMGSMGIYQMYGQNGQPYGGMMNKTPDMPFPPRWLYYVRVADVNAAADRVKRLGGQVLTGPMEVPGGDWVAICMDPQGAGFAVHQTKV